MTQPNPQITTAASSRRVLIVDDDKDFADSMRNLLVLEGYAVECAYAAEPVEALAMRFAPQVVILDYHLGATIGLDLITPLKRRNPDIACLLSTAFSDTDTAVKALRAGVYDYFNKPLDTELLLATLDRCFEMISLKAELAEAELANREAKRHEALSQVIGGVAHHFNNLFAVIQGNLELLADQVADDKIQTGFMKPAQTAIDEAATINQNLVAYARNQALTPEPLDIGAFLLEYGEALQAELKGAAAGHEFKVLCEATEPDVVVLDIVMPGIDGIELVQWLAERGIQLRLVIVTGFAQNYADLAKKLGEAKGLLSVTTLTKPVRMADLQQAICRGDTA